MRKILFACLLIYGFTAAAQNDPCKERILAKKGGFKNSYVQKNGTPNYEMHKKFIDATQSMMQSYQPVGVEAEWSAVHSPAAHGNPFNQYSYTIRAFRYYCFQEGLKVDHETSTKFSVEINHDFGRILFDTTKDYKFEGFNELREGMPEEVRPGVWKFRDVLTPVGFTREGTTILWLLTHPGQLPWTYITRREFLQRRRSNLLRLMKDEEDRLQRNLADLEVQKKNVQKALNGDEAKFAAYLKNDYEPAPKRFKEQRDKMVEQIKGAIERVNEQLEAPAAELNKQAIVIRSEQNQWDYSFTDDWKERFARVLIRPNPAYYKKGLSPSVPQLIRVGIVYYPLDEVDVIFAKEMERLIDVGYLQSFIGKTAPTAYGGKDAVQASIKERSAAPAQQTGTSVVGTQASSRNNTTTVNDKGNAKPAPSATSSQTSNTKGVLLKGKLSAPAGIPITITNNKGSELTITPPKGPGNLFNTSAIQFAKPLQDKESFNVEIKKIPNNMQAFIYKGSGKAPEGMNDLRIVVEYRYELLTRSTDDKAFSNFYETAAPAVGGMGGEEGRYVTFISWTKGFGGNDGKFRQVFWRDRNTGETKLISKAPGGAIADADCVLPTISADGQIVVFESKASNLVPGDNNGKKDVFLWRAKTGTVELISIPAAGGIANGESYDATVSGNGNFVVFTSDAVNMSSTPKGKSLYNIFLRDVLNGKTEMLSVDPSAKTGANGVKASISFDGSRVSFCSPAATLVANDNNSLWDIFLWERGKNGLRRISLTHDGKERLQGDESASRQVASSLSGNGRFVVYSTTAPNMVPNDNQRYQDVFVYDIDNNKLQVASFTADDKPGNHDSPIEQGERIAITYDGTWIAFPTKATNLGVQSSNIILFNTQTGKKEIITDTRGSYVGRPAISYSGSYVVFGKSEPLDQRFGTAFGDLGGGIFARFTGLGPCRDCKE